ncbi:MAG: class I SAM-dependent methyltransferase [Terracidiphilus sp.]|jgi:SAM-dependent methyltransferase
MNTTANSEFIGPESTEFKAKPKTPNFDRLAKHYRWMELFTFGPLLARCRDAFLPELATARRALVLGDGDGRFTAEFLQMNSQVQIDAVDASPAMLDTLMLRVGANAGRVSVHCADVREWQPENTQYDLVVTHFFLDCLTTEECYGLAARLHDAVTPSAVWIISEFAVPEGWFGRIVAGPLVWLLYRAFGVLTGLRIRSLPDHHAALRDSGFALARQRSRLRGTLASEMWRSKT